MNRIIISDEKVFHIWKHPKTGEEIAVHPSYYEESGTPSGDDDMDYEYVRTEIEW